MKYKYKFPLRLSAKETADLYDDAADCIEDIFDVCGTLYEQVCESYQDMQELREQLDEIMFYCHNAATGLKTQYNAGKADADTDSDRFPELPFV